MNPGRRTYRPVTRRSPLAAKIVVIAIAVSVAVTIAIAIEAIMVAVIADLWSAAIIVAVAPLTALYRRLPIAIHQTVAGSRTRRHPVRIANRCFVAGSK